MDIRELKFQLERQGDNMTNDSRLCCRDQAGVHAHANRLIAHIRPQQRRNRPA